MDNNDIHVVEHFYGVYLLYCTNPQYLGRTYIGYTVDPNRRIKQHNKGKKAGGAWKTSNKGPWLMVMIIHGFPNEIAALRFEWAWQHPTSSRRLTHVPKKKSRENVYDFRLRVLSEMLNVGPWNRLPLTIRWLKQEFAREFPVNKIPPIHMPICYGPVISKKLPKTTLENQEMNSSDKFVQESLVCGICEKIFELNSRRLLCLNSDCKLVSHVICLSKYFLDPGNYVPIEGNCPKCKNTYLWGDIIRKFKGCYNNLDVNINVENANNFYSSDSD